MTIRTKIPLGFHCIVPMQCNLAAHRECSRKTAGKMVMGNHTLRLQESAYVQSWEPNAGGTYTHVHGMHMHTDRHTELWELIRS